MLLAKFLSLIIGPILLWPLTLWLILENAHLNYQQSVILYPTLSFLLIIVPFSAILLMLRRHAVNDLDLTKREDRYRPLFLVAGCLLLTLPIVYFFGNSFLFFLFLLFFLLLCLNAFITIFWKISFHMAINTIFVIFINYFYHWSFVYLIIFLPLIFWSRLTLKKHTVNQLIGALILNGAITILFLKYVTGL